MTKYKPLPPLERLHELFEVVEIPPDKFGEWSGLVWKVDKRGRGARVGRVAGTPSPSVCNPNRANWMVGIDGAIYTVSRVIYYMEHGEDPVDSQVDHKDQNWLNNNTWNLRIDVSGGVQKANTPILRTNASGVVGVSWCKERGKWASYVSVKNKQKNLGRYTCKIEAARVVNQKWIELGWDKLGRKLNDLEAIACDCENCVNRRTAKRVIHDSDV